MNNPANPDDVTAATNQQQQVIGKQFQPSSMDELVAAVEEAKAQAEADADTPVTIGDVAAAAFTALETLVAILGGPTSAKGAQVIAAFEDRAAAYTEAEDQ